MNIYLVSRFDNWYRDEYESFVCIAKNEDEARNTGPDGKIIDWENIHIGLEWTDKIKFVEVEYLGIAKEGSKHSVVCAYFNAS